MTLAAMATLILSGISPFSSSQEKFPDRVESFLKGDKKASARGREALFKMGPDALSRLVFIRDRNPGAVRINALNTLIFAIKEGYSGEEGRKIFSKVRQIKITIDMQNAPLQAVMDYIREISGLSIMLDPLLDAANLAVSLKSNDISLKECLRILCQKSSIEYEFRSGILFFARPDRLWRNPTPEKEKEKPISEEEVAIARACITLLSSDSFAERDRASAQLRRMGKGVLPILREAIRKNDADLTLRCRLVIGEIGTIKEKTTDLSIPRQATWRIQEVGKEGQPILKKLKQFKIDMAFENSELADILAFIRDFSGLNILGMDGIRSKFSVFKVKELDLGNVLDLLLLPLGLDMKIEGNMIVIFKQPRTK